MARVFLLSPANCSGLRARRLMAERAAAPLALALRSPGGAVLGEVFAELSALYFRGKVAYARTFARPGRGGPAFLDRGALVITPCQGLRSVESRVTLDDLRTFAGVQVDPGNAAYRAPLEACARDLAVHLRKNGGHAVLLGSVASSKYTDILTAVLGERLLFPVAFVGRGDLSRGGLMLRQVAAGVELEYIPVVGATLHGARPPRLEPLTRKSPGR